MAQLFSNLNRRKFLGITSLATASLMGSTVISLSSCTKENEFDQGEDIDAIVVGSGFGGSVAALRLGQAGIKTILMEMGKNYPVSPVEDVFSGTFSPDGRSTWLKRKTVLPLGPVLPVSSLGLGVLDRVDYENMRIYRGNCVGGGSVVYGCMTVKPDEDWFNSLYNSKITYDELNSKWFPKVQETLQVNTVPQDVLESKYYQFTRVGRQHAAKAGLENIFLGATFDFDILRKEINNQIKKSVCDGELLYGVNNGGKLSLDRNYIPTALGTGNVKLLTQHRVETVRQLENGRFELTVERINETGVAVVKKTYTSKYLFITAGVIGSMEILVKARETGTLPNLSPQVGKMFAYNGNCMMVRKDIKEEVGAFQSTVPIAGFVDRNNTKGFLLAEQTPLPFGIETHSLLNLTVSKNSALGEWVYDEAAQKAILKWPENGHQQSVEASMDYLERMNNANSGTLDKSYFKQGFSTDLTYHPLGGAVLGEASDMYGRLKGYKNLYCLDGSMLPGAAGGANPSFTIAALAERCMEDILKNDI
jgi:cholesterol oxidase